MRVSGFTDDVVGMDPGDHSPHSIGDSRCGGSDIDLKDVECVR